MTDPNVQFKQKIIIFLILIFILHPIGFLYYDFNTILPPRINTTEQPIQKMRKEKNQLIFPSHICKLNGSTKDILLTQNGKIAYIASSSKGVQTLNLKDPYAPKLLATLKYPKSTYNHASSLALSTNEKTLYVKDPTIGIYSIDVRNPQKQKILATYPTVNTPSNISLSDDGKALYIVGKKGLSIVDIRQNDQIKTIMKFNNGEAYYDVVEVAKNTLYLLSLSGIDILDITDLTKPQLIGGFATLGQSRKITLSKDKTRAYISSGDSGIEVIDLKDKLHIQRSGSFTTIGNAINTTVSQNKVTIYVSTFNEDLNIIDARYPHNLELIQRVRKNHIQGQLWSSSLSPDEKILYIAYGDLGIGIVQLKQ
jgi:hypothetical protein